MPTSRPALPIALLLAAIAPLAPGATGDFHTWTGFESRQHDDSTFPQALAVADLDLDGSPDVVIANAWQAPELSVLWNRGDGSFSAPEHHAQGGASFQVATIDVDSDGLPDLVTCDHGSNGQGTTVSVLLNLGEREFAPAASYVAGAGPLDAAAADFDADGDLDLAVTLYGSFGQGSRVALLRNDGSGVFLAPLTFDAGARPYRVAAGDLDADGLPDLVVAREGGKLSVMRNLGNTFAAPVESIVTAQVQGGDLYPNVQLADVDLDGDMDVLYSSTKTSMGNDASFGAVAVLRNDGSGSFGAPDREPVPTWLGGAARSHLADLDGDGVLDYLAAHLDAGGWTYMNGDGLGGFHEGTEVPGGQAPTDLRTADVDGDGWLDVLVVNRDSLALYVYRGSASGEFETHAARPLQGFTHDIAVADVDLDGDLDVAAGGGYAGSGNIELVRNQGDGTFGPAWQVHLGAAAMAVTFRDVSGDGAPDLLWCDHTSAPPYDFWTAVNDGSGNFTPVEWPVGTCGNGDVEAFDMDGDGDLDVFLAEALGCTGTFGNRMFISRNLGGGTFAPATTYQTILRPQRIAHGDVDLDGDEDLVYSVAAGLELARSNGDGTFQAPVAIALPGAGNATVLADLDGDGVLDVATTTVNGPHGIDVFVLLGNGDGSFGAPSIHPAGYSPDLKNADELLARDVDGDGDLDLLALNVGDGDVSLLRNRGDGTFQRQVRYGLGPAATSFAADDFDGDGSVDLIGSVGVPPLDLSKELVTVFGADRAPTPSNYCVLQTNSVGAEARLGWIGTPGAFADDFALLVTGGVPGAPGIAISSDAGPAARPFMGGTLCLRVPLRRMPPAVLGPDGTARIDVPVAASMVGATRWYQFWYRDAQNPSGGGVALSDGLAVTFGD